MELLKFSSTMHSPAPVFVLILIPHSYPYPLLFLSFSRFKSRTVRCLASATYIVRQICNLGITVYTPSVALSTVIGIPYWASITGMAVICIFFTIMVRTVLIAVPRECQRFNDENI